MLPVYRKEPRKVLLEYLIWLHAIKKDQISGEIMDTNREFINTEKFNWKEASERDNKRKFLLNRLFREQRPKTVKG